MIFGKWIDKRIEAYQSDLMKKYCDEVESMYTKMRGWRHDYHNHIQAMQASMALGRYQEVSDYLRELNDDLVNVDTVLKTGRVMVDAILNGKISIAAGNDIPVNAKAKLPPNLDMNDVDLCVVIGNLMDNAIEENRKLNPEKRFLRIYIGMKNTQLYIAVTNAAGKKGEGRRPVPLLQGRPARIRPGQGGEHREEVRRNLHRGQRGRRIHSGGADSCFIRHFVHRKLHFVI